jgi:hypothetical protein
MTLTPPRFARLILTCYVHLLETYSVDAPCSMPEPVQGLLFWLRRQFLALTPEAGIYGHKPGISLAYLCSSVELHLLILLILQLRVQLKSN